MKIFIVLAFPFLFLNPSSNSEQMLREKLTKDGFTFLEIKNSDVGIVNCQTKQKVALDPNSQTHFYAKSKKDKPEGYYPDFSVTILKFKDLKTASRNFEKAKMGMKSDREFCNGKGPNKLALNNNEILYFRTRAEMFRKYTDKYGDYITNSR